MYTFKDLVEITAKLRAEDGCPWDREQTFESLRKYMREEAEEAVQAVDNEDMENLCEELGMELIAVHVNHGIRGEEAMEDQRFVENLCERLGVKIRICSGKVPELAKAEKLSEEEAGRIFRRQCFEKICKEEKADKIVLAHHRDDNAETFLFHLSRGSGLKGAGGMRPVNGSYVRPLLGVGRKEIESWLEEQLSLFDFI